MSIHKGRRALELASTATLLIPLLAHAPAAAAQGAAPDRLGLFDVGAAADLALDAEQAAKLARYRADPAAAVTVVRVATDRLPEPDSVELQLGAKPPVVLDRRGLTERAPRGYSWHGRSAAAASGNPRDTSEATLVVNGDSVVGTIRSQGELYRLRPLGGGLSALIQLDPSRMPPEHPPGFDRQAVPPDDGPQRDGAAADDDCGTYNLMVAYRQRQVPGGRHRRADPARRRRD
jgi:peptidyl-Asp metalloendopeptidase